MNIRHCLQFKQGNNLNRKVFEQVMGFESINFYPKLPCPYCNQNDLALDRQTITYKMVSLSDAPTIVKKTMKENIDFVDNTYKKNKLLGILAVVAIGTTAVLERHAKFICFFTCTNCSKNVSSTGTMKLERNGSLDSACIKVEYFSPPIPLFNLSNNIPENIREEILQAFNHFHSDITSSGTKLRRGIEKMCSDLGFKEKNLHASISSLSKMYPKEGALLHSLKLLGNDAVHSDNLEIYDLLNAFEIIDFVLHLYERVAQEKVINEKALELEKKFANKMRDK